MQSASAIEEYSSSFLRGEEYGPDSDQEDDGENVILPWNVKVTQYAGSKKCASKVTILVYFTCLFL